jgi:large subunit ribosomal protein L25
MRSEETMSDMTIAVEQRAKTGTNSNRRLRLSGQIPAVVYGAGKDTVPIHVDRKRLIELLKQSGGDNAIFLLKLGGGGDERHAMIREMQLHPITREILHLDFQHVLMTEKVRVQVAIELSGVAYGVKTDGGVLDFSHREVHVELDVNDLHLGQHLTAGDLELPDGVVLLDEADRVLVSVMHSKTEAVPAEEAAAAGEGEPEVIKKGKTEEA